MTIMLPTLAAAFAAFCVGLTVRIVNRREQWAKWTAAAVIVIPVLYVLSNGPAAALYANPDVPPIFKTTADWFYAPIGWVCQESPQVAKARQWYVMLWIR